MTTIKIKVYACRYCELISADPKKFIPTAVDSGDLPSMQDFLEQQFSIDDLYESLEDDHALVDKQLKGVTLLNL